MYGGIETFIAVKDKFQANVITLNMDGEILPPLCFNHTFNQTLVLCCAGDQFYKSVVNIPPNMIETISKDIAAKFNLKQQ